MINFKEVIAKEISSVINIKYTELAGYIEVPKESINGDYAFPCFRLAKELKRNPIEIASDIKQKIELDENIIEKMEVASGYLNFYINKRLLVEEVLNEISENYGESNIGKGKNVVIDYSAPNIAKPFHIGHLRSTVIGAALYRVYKCLGYTVTGVNHLGDYGTQFGKLIEGYKMWGTEYNIESDPINELTKIYIRINELCKEDESVLEACRNNFKLLEDGDKYCIDIWQKFRDLSLVEFKKIYNQLGSKFDSWNGEAFYSDKMGEIIDILDKTGKLELSQGAKIIDLEDKRIPVPCIIEKSNGSTTYATRDLAALMYRARNYDFDKAIYVTSYEQTLHFKQIFEVAKLLGLDEKYTNGLVHVPFGMVMLPEGKMSTRGGKIVKLEELLEEAVKRAEEIIEEKNSNLENKKEIAKCVGIGAVIFSDLQNSRIKDEIFEWDKMLNFQGETGPYIQYTFVRTQSILERVGKIPQVQEIQISNLLDKESINLVKLIYSFEDTLISVTKKEEPSILSRYLIDLAQSFSNFYNENKIIVDDEEIKNARVFLTYAVNHCLEKGLGLLGIKCPDKM